MEYESLRYSSWCLSRLLEKIIGTDDEVASRRKVWSMVNYVYDAGPYEKLLFSGSKAEGFMFGSSDVDGMIISKCIVVTESPQNLRSGDQNKTVLLIRRDTCNPGFVILQPKNRTNIHSIRESLVKYKNFAVVSNVLYRDEHRRPEFGEEAHGPCNTISFGCDLDIAHCFQCNKWPSEAYEFIQRPRLHGWPSNLLIDKIVTGSCHLVPIGDKDHDLSYIQWRLSFSAAEKVLIDSFNHTQFLVYGLMKIFLKQVINKVKSVEDLLCSYFLKTALFYSIECTPRSFWREDLIIPCFWFCFKKLIKWIERGYCPNFFVPENNMFRSKVYGENQHRLISVLKQFESNGWTCICLSEDLRDVQNILNHPVSVSHFSLIPSGVNIEYRLDMDMLGLLFGSGYFSVSLIRRGFARSLMLLWCSRSQKEQDISTFKLLDVLGCAAHENFCSEIGQHNKRRYKSVKKCEILLHKAAHRNVSVGPLNLATYYYTTGQYNKAVQVCQRVISHWKPFVLYLPINQNNVTEYYKVYVCGRGICAADKARKACASYIYMFSSYKSFYPAELSDDIEATSPFPSLIPPLPYTEFLLSLCHIKLGNIYSSLVALRDLQVLVHDEAQGYRYYPVVLNMLTICLEKFGCTERAIDICLLSQELKPQRNGTVKLLEKLLSEHSY